MVEIHAHDVRVFGNGWKVATVTKPGSMKQPTKSGPVDVPFQVGDAVLVGASGTIVVAPLSFAGATEIARLVIECDPRTLTDGHSLRALATAVIGFAAQTVAAEPIHDNSLCVPVRHLRLSAEETEEYERTGKLRGSFRRFAEANLITDANGRVLKSWDAAVPEETQP